MDDLILRLRDAGSTLLRLRDPLVAGEPWPLSDAYGTEPEADWGPREVLAHVAEMLPYWTDQLGTIIAGDPAAAVPFGRVATDAARIGRIGADRDRSVAELLDEMTRGLDRAAGFLGGLSAAEAERRGVHPTRGELSVRAAADRFLVSHLEEHVEQLERILETRSGA